MGDHYKTCELHGKPFPNNLIDTNKVEVIRLYAEKKEEIEGKNMTLSLFVGDKTENEGVDVCVSCAQEKLFNLLSANGDAPTWKGITWNKVTMQKKDGSGTYERNEKTIMKPEEIREKIKAEKKAQAQAPTTK